MRWVRPLVSVALVSGVLLGCASIQNAPVNLPGSDNLAENGNIGFGETASFDDTIVGLSFSAIARAGADTFVAGSAVFGAGRAEDVHRYDSVINALRAELAKV